MTVTEKRPWERLRSLMEAGEPRAVEDYLHTLGADRLVRSLFRLTEAEQRALLNLVSNDSAAEVIEGLPETHAAELLEEMTAVDAAQIVEELASDEQADVLAEMDASDAAAILEEMDEEEAAETRRLLEFEPDCAGGLMQTEFMAFPRDATVRDVINDLAEREEDYALYAPQFIYVVLKRVKLLGVLRLRDIVFGDADTRIGEIMQPALTIRPETPLTQLHEFFADNTLNAVPVVDERQHILGVVRRRAVAEAISRQSESERLRQAGIVGGEELRSMPVALRSRRRLSWLSINIVLNLLAASVIALYQDTLSAVIALAVFLPIVSDMSGCSGNQAVAVSLRELTLGVVAPGDLARVWAKEAAVGVLNGLALGALIAVAAIAWQGNPWLGLVIGTALALNTIVAVSIGGTVPLFLKSMGVDPALASGPVLTTITDMCGFFLVLSLATVSLPLLT